MRPERLSLVHLLLIVSLSTVMLSAHLARAQEMSPASEASTQASIFAPHSVAIPEAGLRFNPAYEELSLPFAPHQELSSLRFRSFEGANIIPLGKNDTSNGPWRFTKIDEPLGKANQFIGNVPTEWLTYPIPHNTVPYRAPGGGDVLQYYGHRIPWAGRIMLGVGRQAEFHPRVLRLFELVSPALSLGKPTYPRWLGR
jgi:hypothetical protein